jgi:hypothetical protein
MYDAAIRDGRHAAAIAEEIGDSRRRCLALTALAATFSALRRANVAYSLCIDALDILGELPESDIHHLRDRIKAILEAIAPHATSSHVA